MEAPHDPSADPTIYPIPSTLTVAPQPLPILGELPLRNPPPVRHRRIRRQILWPVLLFAATCLTTFWAGAVPSGGFKMVIQNFANPHVKGVIIECLMNWHSGWVYMVAVMGILLAHEMGHFLQAVRYGVPASLPFFIPMPLTPLGTMGAVIGMQGSQADRKELFDIGISGPLAGLVVALPLAWIGIKTAVPVPINAMMNVHFQFPLLFKTLMSYLHPELLPGQELQMNPLLMAGWVGMLITGLNMLPISQLDGGHVAYAILGRGSYWLARGVLVAALAFIFIAHVYGWIIMLLLVTLIGVEHPPTANDRQELGAARRILGLVSLAIPVLCLAPDPISFVGR